jgi:polysaccharide pyruvyl transferase WcaK-like protein
MKIGIIGWYGRSNAGDERILYCLKKYFAGQDISVFTAWQDAWERVEELNRCDFVLIGGGGLIIPGVGHSSKLLSSIHVPFGCVGISVETKHASVGEFVSLLMDKAEFVLVRDHQSADYLGFHDKVLVGPDLTFLYPFDVVDLFQKEIVGVNLRPWHYWRGELYTPSYHWMSILNGKFPSLKQIYPFSKWDPKRITTALRQQFSTLLPLPLDTSPNSSNDIQLLELFFDNVDPKFSPGSLATCRYLVGMRLHSLIFACQMGIPFISLSYMPKNEQFCQEIGLPHMSVPLHDYRHFPIVLANLLKDARQIREHLIEIRYENSCLINQQMSQIKRAIGS